MPTRHPKRRRVPIGAGWELVTDSAMKFFQLRPRLRELFCRFRERVAGYSKAGGAENSILGVVTNFGIALCVGEIVSDAVREIEAVETSKKSQNINTRASYPLLDNAMSALSLAGNSEAEMGIAINITTH